MALVLSPCEKLHAGLVETSSPCTRTSRHFKGLVSLTRQRQAKSYSRTSRSRSSSCSKQPEAFSRKHPSSVALSNHLTAGKARYEFATAGVA